MIFFYQGDGTLPMGATEHRSPHTEVASPMMNSISCTTGAAMSRGGLGELSVTRNTLLKVGAAALLAFAGLSSAALGQAISPTGRISGGTYSIGGYGTSSDGEVATGYADSPGGSRAFRWVRDQGAVSLGTLPGGTFSFGNVVSGNGEFIVGTSGSGDGIRAYRWSVAAGMESLGLLPDGFYTFAQSISADGNVIVGFGSTALGDRAYRWTMSGGLESLGTLPNGFNSGAYSVSPDGQFIVGYSEAGPDSVHAFLWSEGGGMVDLGVPSGAVSSLAYGVNADGTAVVGGAERPDGTSRAFRWTPGGGMEDLGALPIRTGALAVGVSGDGNTVVGTTRFQSATTAFVWTPDTGMVDLNEYLSARGVNLDGWYLFEGRGVSADARTFTGTGVYFGEILGFVAWLDADCTSCPADFNCDSSINSQDFYEFMENFINQSPRSDFNRDGSRDSRDLFDYLNVLFTGC